jgi:hypothetical protein
VLNFFPPAGHNLALPPLLGQQAGFSPQASISSSAVQIVNIRRNIHCIGKIPRLALLTSYYSTAL